MGMTKQHNLGSDLLRLKLKWQKRAFDIILMPVAGKKPFAAYGEYAFQRVSLVKIVIVASYRGYDLSGEFCLEVSAVICHIAKVKGVVGV